MAIADYNDGHANGSWADGTQFTADDGNDLTRLIDQKLEIDGDLAMTGDLDIGSGNTLKTDTITESTGAAGVTIDGVLLKDNAISVSGTVDGRDVAADGTEQDKQTSVLVSAQLGDVASTTGGATFDDVVTYHATTGHYDPGGVFNVTTGVYTVSASGVFKVSGGVYVSGGSSGQTASLSLSKNSADYTMAYMSLDTNGRGFMAASVVHSFSGAGAITMRVNTSAAGYVVSNGWIVVERIGD
jgi:hypothetical protein